MAPKKKARRVRGPDGKLYTKEELQKLKTNADTTGATESTDLKVKTEGAEAREKSKKGSVQEKVKKAEKDDGPVIIVSYKDNTGKRVTKQFTCDRIEMTENRQKTLQRSGPQTRLDIYIEASVIDEM
jgi:hypothetical protein